MTTRRVTTECTFEDAHATRAMIKAGGGTVISTRAIELGNPRAGFTIGYDMPIEEDE